MNSRILKVCPTNTRGTFFVVPSIKLQGLWLEDWGFRVGSKVEVTKKGKSGVIIIKLLLE